MNIFAKSKYNRGMTIVELLVVLSIFSIISMTVAFNYSGYKSSTSTQVLSQDVALSIREAQGYAIGVKSANSIFPGYGIHFSMEPGNGFSGDQKSFILFADVNNNKTYDQNTNTCGSDSVSAGSECVSSTTISGSDKIVGFCMDSGCDDISNSNNLKTTGSLDIVFHRPNPDAQFNYCDVSSCKISSSVGIIVQSDSNLGITKKIIVWNTGQISIK